MCISNNKLRYIVDLIIAFNHIRSVGSLEQSLELLFHIETLKGNVASIAISVVVIKQRSAWQRAESHMYFVIVSLLIIPMKYIFMIGFDYII